MRFWRQRYSLDSGNTVWQRSMATSSSPPEYQLVPRVESLPATPNEQYISVKREMLAIQILLKTVSQPSSTSDCHHEAPAAKKSLPATILDRVQVINYSFGKKGWKLVLRLSLLVLLCIASKNLLHHYLQ